MKYVQVLISLLLCAGVLVATHWWMSSDNAPMVAANNVPTKPNVTQRKTSEAIRLNIDGTIPSKVVLGTETFAMVTDASKKYGYGCNEKQCLVVATGSVTKVPVTEKARLKQYLEQMK